MQTPGTDVLRPLVHVKGDLRDALDPGSIEAQADPLGRHQRRILLRQRVVETEPFAVVGKRSLRTERGRGKKYRAEIGQFELLSEFVGQFQRRLRQTETALAGFVPAYARIVFGEEFTDTVDSIRGKIPTDFGRSRGIAWYAELGYGIVHTNAAQSRIIKWDTLS